MIEAHTTGVDGTRELAARMAEVARPGDVLLLAGELGSGKTAFAQGLARGLGVDEQVTSPTFTLVRCYEGRIPLNHIDVYRLEHMQEVLDLGLPELVDEQAVTIIEWGDTVAPLVGADFLEVRLQRGAGDDDRTIVLTPAGRSWAGRAVMLEKAVEPWSGRE